MTIAKTTLLCLLLALLSACNTATNESKIGTDSLPPDIPVPVSTAYKFPELNWPPGYSLGMLALYDSASRARYEADFLQSSAQSLNGFSEASLEAVKQRIQYEQQYVDPYKGDSPVDPMYTFKMAPVAFYSDSSVISVTYVADTYGEGGNHHNYSWFTFNYDLKKKKRICFRDFFGLRGRKDSVDFAGLVYRHRLEDCMDFDAPFDSVDFAFTAGGIYINPELSWACAQNRSLIPTDSLRHFIKSEWKKKR
jgi:hypothetical protein